MSDTNRPTGGISLSPQETEDFLNRMPIQPAGRANLPQKWQRYIDQLLQAALEFRAAQQLAEQQTIQTFTHPGNSAPTKVYALPGGAGLSKDFQPLAHGTEIEFRNLFDNQHGTDLTARINGGYHQRANKDWLEISADTQILIRSASSNRVLIRAEGHTR